MSTTSTVDRAFEAALYADTDAALDTGASLLAADPAADAELALRGREFVAGAWRRGWQPADVVRFTRRELEDEHVRLLARLVVEEHETIRPGA
ncbi:aromatic acid decarboxylase, partial [Streptomyces sp. MB09-02B]|nr:aromatic acid decarboxylase [Streptomyces sp. MB09-02B]